MQAFDKRILNDNICKSHIQKKLATIAKNSCQLMFVIVLFSCIFATV